MLDDSDPKISYKIDGEWANFEVEDDSEIELALSKASGSNKRAITFFIKTSKSLDLKDVYAPHKMNRMEKKNKYANKEGKENK